ncbi:MAG: hypothetical protein SFX73_26370 [Kofleriaceae bacterium]|nr:hypothetical protein [Kofleriaceae bacterium]
MAKIIVGYASVELLVGAPGGAGYLDGPFASARFDQNTHITVDGAGGWYVADGLNGVLRKLSAAGQVERARTGERF